ncbi:MAG: hypothetical protein OET90_02020 [Desulfuromonadales bacterium]|nr:hypothetical protein [Desulfuromonadales bacterium]
MTKQKGGRQDFLNSVAIKSIKILTGKGMPEKEAMSVAVELTDSLRSVFGGDSIYIKKGAAFTRATRNAQIVKDFDGSNTSQLAQDYGLTKRQVQRILSEDRQKKMKK